MSVTPPEELRRLLANALEGRWSYELLTNADDVQFLLDALVNSLPAYLDLAEDMRRLASTDSFTTMLDLAHSSRDALADELRARGMFAEKSMARVEGK